MAGHVTSGSRTIGVAGSVEEIISGRPASMICGFGSVLVMQSPGEAAVRNDFIILSWWR